MSISQRSSRFKGVGQIVSIAPSSGTPITVFESYQIQSLGQPASVIHGQNPILKPGTTTALSSSAIFFEPNETYRDGSDEPQYTQFVINANAAIGSGLQLSTYNEYFTVRDPGVVTPDGDFSVGTDSGAAVRFPKVTKMPVQRPREGVVTVTLVTTGDADTVAAYNDLKSDGDPFTFASISFNTFFTKNSGADTSVSASHRTFNGYCRGDTANLSGNTSTITSTSITLGSFGTFATTRMTGDPESSYVKTGIYRSKVTPFLRTVDGNQTFLKTNVTFS